MYFIVLKLIFLQTQLQVYPWRKQPSSRIPPQVKFLQVFRRRLPALRCRLRRDHRQVHQRLPCQAVRLQPHTRTGILTVRASSEGSSWPWVWWPWGWCHSSSTRHAPRGTITLSKASLFDIPTPSCYVVLVQSVTFAVDGLLLRLDFLEQFCTHIE